ncbi:MAG: hypothetical protein GZ088_09930 [Acidipila sp.]|nr:hypothetical protein [Acidipila sp.]
MLFRDVLVPNAKKLAESCVHARKSLQGVLEKSLAARLVLFLAFATSFFAALGIYHIYFDRRELPDLDGFIRFEPPSVGHVYGANGEVLAEMAKERREVLDYREIPPVMREALLSAEDKDFFSHSGLSYTGIFRTLGKINFGSSKREFFPQGGSTITQQLVRGYFLRGITSNENGAQLEWNRPVPWLLSVFIGARGTNKLLRKIEEMRLSVWIEEEMQRRFGSKQRAKEELLARYANYIFLGNRRYGFAAASEYYFGRPLTTLTAEDADKAALLAGIPKSPRDYAPTDANASRVLRRRNHILAQMAANHYLTEESAARCARKPLDFVAATNSGVAAPAAVKTVLGELNELGENLKGENLLTGHIQVYSTVDSRIQRIATEALESSVKAYEKRHPKSVGMLQGAAVVLRNSDAAILAEVGGRQMYNARPSAYPDYNRATESLRQPGSAMKPIVYLAAFQAGMLTLDSPVPDAPIRVANGSGGAVKWISNYDGRFEGIIAARQALAESRNAVAVWISEQIGIHSIIRTAQSLRIHSRLEPYATTALGASEVTLLELANAYRTLASSIDADPHIVEKVQGGRGEVLYAHSGWHSDVHDAALSLIQEGLRGVVRIPGGTAHALDSTAIPVMGKTGTTSNYRDAIFVGSTYGPRGITVAVRLGFDDAHSLGAGETGGRAALPAFREIMAKIYKSKLAGSAPAFPAEIEQSIDAYLRGEKPLDPAAAARLGSGGTEAVASMWPCGNESGEFKVPCRTAQTAAPVFYKTQDNRGRVVYVNE